MSLSSKHVVLIGAGAIGSTISELLVRGGVNKLTIVDGDQLAVGNLVRHTLTMPQIGKPKATALANRLNACSPHAVTTAINTNFPPASAPARRLLAACDLVLNCTADDAVLHYIEEFPWEGTKLFVTVSVGYRAHRLYVFAHSGDSFSRETYYDLVGPWLLKERSETEGVEMPWEGTGCWQPVFPAGAEDIWLMSSIATKYLETLVDRPLGDPSLVVFEQVIVGDAFWGMQQVTLT
jgi:hypothetical protein